GELIAAAAQSAGRGSHARAYFCPPNCGVYFSLLLRPKNPREESLAITPMAAVACSLAIDAVFGVKTGIKWVNDIYLRGKKVAGILAESDGRAVILGVGVNISPPPSGFPDLPNAGAITCNPPELARENLIAQFVSLFWELYSALPDTEFIAEYRARSIILGRDIFLDGERVRAKNISDDFGLVIELSDHTQQTLNSGEVSITL
ncbi:MAG: biotin--[acetyl-CoA-carboxylase] ligase, partial [Oscillospiraceae bacterium]|nr:biotin--[acetyl-CoA-carboxylase] ligase [Oscillospiraceae bacterium]